MNGTTRQSAETGRTLRVLALACASGLLVACETSAPAPRPGPRVNLADAAEIFKRPRFGTAAPMDAGPEGGTAEEFATRAEGERPADAGNTTATVAATVAEDAKAWTIVLAAFRDQQQAGAAAEALARLRQIPGLEGAFVTTRGGATFVGLGAFESPTEPAAQSRLAEVRGMVVGSERLFSQSFMAPPVVAAMEGTRPEFALTAVRDQFGKSAKMTLAIAGYEAPRGAPESDRAEARKQAEAAVLELRRQGELAFYHHGPTQSSVTVGVFAEGDLATRARPEDPRLSALRKRFPNYLLNGAGVRQKSGGVERMVTCQLVEIPASR
ncbi:MAG: hypothetical protein ACT4PL_12755 [Phycisphaerales bacterium]